MAWFPYLYGLCAVICWPCFAYGILYVRGGPYYSEDYGFATILGFLVASIWPLGLIALGIMWLLARYFPREAKGHDDHP
jgi:hypothetical protein